MGRKVLVIENDPAIQNLLRTYMGSDQGGTVYIQEGSMVATTSPEMFEVRPMDDPLYDYYHVELSHVQIDTIDWNNDSGLACSTAQTVEELNRTKGRGWTLYFIRLTGRTQSPVAYFRRVRLPVRPLTW